MIRLQGFYKSTHPANPLIMRIKVQTFDRKSPMGILLMNGAIVFIIASQAMINPAAIAA